MSHLAYLLTSILPLWFLRSITPSIWAFAGNSGLSAIHHSIWSISTNRDDGYVAMPCSSNPRPTNIDMKVIGTPSANAGFK